MASTETTESQKRTVSRESIIPPQNEGAGYLRVKKHGQHVTLVKGIALVGLNDIGMFFVDLLAGSQRASLVYVVDNDDQRLSSVKKRHGCSATHFVHEDQLERVYRDLSVDALIVTVPLPRRKGIVLAALNGDKSVLYEPLLAPNSSDTKKCFERAILVNQVLMPLYPRRYDKTMKIICDRIHRKEVGRVEMVRICHRDQSLKGSSIFYDMASQDIDFVCWLLQEHPLKVFCFGHSRYNASQEAEDPEVLLITMQFPSGVIGVIELCRSWSCGLDDRLEISGRNGILVSDERKVFEIQTHSSPDVRQSQVRDGAHPKHHSRCSSALDHFLDLMQGNEERAVEAQESISVCRIVMACELAFRTGRCVTIKWENEDVIPFSRPLEKKLAQRRISEVHREKGMPASQTRRHSRDFHFDLLPEALH